MFGLSARGSYRASTRGGAVLSGRSPTFQAAYNHFVDACARIIASSRVRSGSPETTAAQIWSFMHGFTALEMAGHFEDLHNPVNDVLMPLANNVMVGLGDSPEAATASGLAALQRHNRRSAPTDPKNCEA
jgi:hypothetical protein